MSPPPPPPPPLLPPSSLYPPASSTPIPEFKFLERCLNQVGSMGRRKEAADSHVFLNSTTPCIMELRRTMQEDTYSVGDSFLEEWSRDELEVLDGRPEVRTSLRRIVYYV
jgi:hypothetical protein